MFYNGYAKYVGFCVSIKTSRRSKLDRQLIDVKYAYIRYGKKQQSNARNPRPCLKVKCDACLWIRRSCDGKWIVHSIIKDHNHELFPSHARYFPCHWGINQAQKNCIKNLQHAGVKTRKIVVTMTKQHEGYENIGCLEKDIRNHLNEIVVWL